MTDALTALRSTWKLMLWLHVGYSRATMLPRQGASECFSEWLRVKGGKVTLHSLVAQLGEKWLMIACPVLYDSFTSTA